MAWQSVCNPREVETGFAGLADDGSEGEVAYYTSVRIWSPRAHAKVMHSDGMQAWMGRRAEPKWDRQCMEVVTQIGWLQVVERPQRKQKQEAVVWGVMQVGDLHRVF